MKAFNIEANDAERIINSVNEVANHFSVSSADLARNLGNMSAIMAINNVTMEQQIGMLTGVTEITRNASSASRGLVMISSRLTQVLDDTSSTGKKLTQIYKDLGIELKDENGQLRGHYEILGDLAQKWDTLSENQQKYIALTSAGARQQQNFVALMDNWNQVAKATATAYESVGSAQRENEKVMDSIAKKLEILKSQFQQLVIGKGGLQDFAKKILDLGISLLKFANSDIGKLIITLSTLGLATRSLIGHWGDLIKILKSTGLGRLIADISALHNGQMLATSSTLALKIAQEGLAKALWEVATAWLATPFGAATVAIGATLAIMAAIYKVNNALYDSNEELLKLQDVVADDKSEIESLEEELKKTKEQLNKLNSDKLKITDSSQLRELKKQTTELETQEHILEHQVQLAKERFEQDKKDAEKQAKETLNKTVTSQFGTPKQQDTSWGTNINTGDVVTEKVKPTEELRRAAYEVRELTEKREEMLNVSRALEEQEGKTSTAYQVQNQHIKELQDQIDSAKARGIEMAEIVQNSTSELTSQDEETVKLRDNYEKLLDFWHDIATAETEGNDAIEKTAEELEAEKEAAEEAAEAQEELSKELQSLCQAVGITTTEFRGLQEAFGGNDEALLSYLQTLAQIKQEISDTNTVIDNLQDAMTTAQAALDEYTASGSLTVDTFQSLMSISAQYLTALVNENGQLTINQTTLGNLIEKLKVAKIEELQMAEATDIAAYAQGDLDKMSALARNSLINVGNAAITAGKNAESSAKGWWTLAEAIASAKTIAGDNTDIASDINIQRIHNSYRKLANQISEIKVNTTAAGQATSKAGKAAKSAGKAAKSAGKAAKDAGKEAEEAAKKAKKALEDEVKALEKKQKQYERVIKWIEKQYDKRIDKIKKEKDEALDAIEAQIKAREKEKDKALDAIEAEIKALKDQKDARKKYWDDQIDALKKANQEKKDALELQEKLDALEKAKRTKVKIYKEGQGFVYDVDQTAVKEAQKILDEYLSEKAYEEELERLEKLRDAELDNYEKRIDSLEKYKDQVEANFEAQIENLEAYKEQVEAQYDAQIKIYEDAKQKFEDMVNAYEEEQDRLLALELAGINAENDNWMLRLDNLQNFVSEYHSLLKQVEDAKERLDALNNQETTPTTSTASSGSITSTSGSGTKPVNPSKNPKTYTTHADILPTVTQQSVTATKKIGSSTAKKTIADGAKSSSNPYASLFKHANGIDTIPNDEIAIVGESPNQEMVIGSKLNGKLMSLDKGTGVVNAESSKSLAGMLNQVGKFGASGFGSGGGTLNTNYNNDSLTINGVTIQGANIKDPETFVNGLLSLKSEALQRAYKHK